ncbi:hypothetical protein OHA74_25065 [Streptomyces phaeochromogenes]|uniref:Uncharacterized protein n=1 Tax=Streptomyces phaeochromogenes TaxID=1923 RepID=A0ABZ1HA30_STRPH|nr:hypothetical protein [Streptomyces phaeochromogenes]WSD15434.1 hypothetical protein OHB35_20445 [Streptomyces phaeochromogenes]
MATSNEHPPDGWAFLGIGDPLLVVHDERRDLLAVAGTDAHSRTTPVAVYNSRFFVRRTLIGSRFPVHAMAFHPRRPLLAIGTGKYDGGYFFEGELLLMNVKTGAVASLIEHEIGRQVLGLEWLDEQYLGVLMAPSDDWQDEAAHEYGHVAVVGRTDWTAVPAQSLDGGDLAGPRIPAPRPDLREAAQRAAAELRSLWQARRAVPSQNPGRPWG